MTRFPPASPGARRRRILLLSGLGLLWALLAVSQAAVTSAITADGTLGTTVTRSGTLHTIAGGTRPGNGPNLFHSFDRFSVGTEDTARFSGPAGITNILSRVTGGQRSEIDGRLQSTIEGAHLYLLNPSGVIFGPNARLDVSGSFHVSTADFLRFTDGAKFSANLGQESVLTVASPTAFGFLGHTPAAMTIQGSHLRVTDGQIMSVVGGDIDIIGNSGPITDTTVPTLSAPSGRIHLASVASPGEVGFSPLELAPDLQVDGFTRLGRIELSRAALVTARTEGSRQAGAIAVRGGQVRLSGGSQLTSNTASTGSTGAAGRIVVAAPVVSLTEQGGIEARARGGSSGNAGEVEVRAGTLTLAGGATISARTGGAGHGGAIELRAGTLTLTGEGRIEVGTTGQGNGGTIEVQVGRLTLTDGASISASTGGAGQTGQGGNITVTAREAIVIAGRDKTGDPSRLSVNATSTGDAGRIVVSAPTLSLMEEGAIRARTSGAGHGGAIELQVGTLTLTGGANIGSGTLGEGRGGDVTVAAREAIVIAGRSGTGDRSLSRLSSNVNSTGDAGRIVVSAPIVSLMAEGEIVARTFEGTHGHGGVIEVRAGTLTLTGGARISSSTLGQGQGGDLLVMAEHIDLRDGGTMVASSSSDGPAGTIRIQAGETFRSHRGDVTTQSDRAGGGTIELKAGTLAYLRDSQITTSVQGGGADAGNLTIDARFTLLDHSRIIANAFKGQGGNIDIGAQVFLADPATLLDASSALGISGTVDIQAPVTTLSETLAPLPQAFVNVAALLPARCAARFSGGTASSLVLGGRGGLPPEPGGVLPSPLALEERLAAAPAVTGGAPHEPSPARFAFLAAQERAFPRLHGHPLARGCPQ
jgi:filamentous hemagglutinin family protein